MYRLMSHGDVAVVRIQLVPVRGDVDSVPDRGLIAVEKRSHGAEGDADERVVDGATQPAVILSDDPKSWKLLAQQLQVRLIALFPRYPNRDSIRD